MNVTEMTIEELQKEIDARKVKEAAASRPKRLEKPDMKKTIILMEAHMDSLWKAHMDNLSIYKEDDIEHWLYEQVMEDLYGPAVWEWII